MAELLPSEELVDDPSDFGSLRPGTRLGRYELLVPIARGGMARVWAARLHGQRGFSKLVAIKTILPHLAREPEFERMFLDEARIASGVHHPNVCEIYELGEESRTLYLVMEWVSGDSLSRVLRSSGKTEHIDPRVAARIIADASAGVHSAHELTDDEGRALGVVHRDLSPHNILLTADGVAKVADFGVAKALGQLHDATSAGQLKGKLAYMAPEQVQGGGIDRRSDVFSLGCVLYEATTGLRPFRGDGDHQVMHAVLKGEFQPPTAIIKGYPQELERIILRAMSPQPILRFPTAERMRFALEEFLTHGQLVTQSNVAQVVRARIGTTIDKRKERIKQASLAGDRATPGAEREKGWSEPPGASHTPSNQAEGHRSGVKQAPPKPLYTTVAMPSPEVPSAAGPPVRHPTPVVPAGAPQPVNVPRAASVPQEETVGLSGHPWSSTTIPQASYEPPPRPKMGMTLPLGMTPAQIPGAPAPTGSNPDWSNAGRAATQTVPPGSGPVSGAQPPPSRDPIPWDPGVPEPARESASTGQYALAAGIGLLIAAIIGVGGFLFWRSRSAETPPPVVAPQTSAPGSSATPQASTAAPSTVSPEITFTVSPPDATLSVDGRDLGDARKLARPPAGTNVMVVARAKDHEDVTVLVDYFTTSPLEITLKPRGAGAAAEMDSGVVAPTAPTAATPPTPLPKPRPANRGPRDQNPNGLPANPY
jgi:eukaryotic-like serine/threonine-protein kinase